MPAENLRAQVWESMLDSDYRARYFGALATRQRRLHATLSWAVALASTAVVASLLAGAEELPWLTGAVAVLAAALGWILTFGRMGERTTEASHLHRKWGEVNTQFRELWFTFEQLEEEEAMGRWKSIEDGHAELDQTAVAQFSYKKRLAEKLYNDMLRAEVAA